MNRKILVTVLATVGAVAILTAGVAFNSDGRPASGAALTVTAAPGPAVTPSPTAPALASATGGAAVVNAAQAAAVVARDQAEFPGGLESSVGFQTTLATLASQHYFDVPNGFNPAKTVWVSLGTGAFVPQLSHGEKFAWGALVIDPADGAVLGSFARPGPVPATFPK